MKTRQFSVAPVSSCLPLPADLSPFSSSSSPPPTLPLPPSPNRSCEEEPPPTGVGPRNRKCPLERRRQPHVTILQRVHESRNSASVWSCVCLECYKTPCVLWGEPMGILFETKRSNSVYSHNVGQSEAREIKAGTGSTETCGKFGSLRRLRRNMKLIKCQWQKMMYVGGKNPEKKNRKSVVFFSPALVAICRFRT